MKMPMLKKGDVLLVLLIVFCISLGAVVNDGNNTESLAIWNNINNPGKGDVIAVVRKDGKAIKTINLTKLKKRETIKVSGQYIDTIVVDNKRICFSSTDCPDKKCVEAGWLSKPGQVAICLPNRTSISLSSVNTKEDNTDGAAR